MSEGGDTEAKRELSTAERWLGVEKSKLSSRTLNLGYNLFTTGEKLPEKAEKAFMNPFRLGPTAQIFPRERQRRGNWTDHVVI